MDDKRLERIENKIDVLVDKMGEQNATLAAQHISLKEHIRRTDLLEKQMEPVRIHVANVQGILRFIGVLAMLAAIAEAIAVVKSGGGGK